MLDVVRSGRNIVAEIAFWISIRCLDMIINGGSNQSTYSWYLSLHKGTQALYCFSFETLQLLLAHLFLHISTKKAFSTNFSYYNKIYYTPLSHKCWLMLRRWAWSPSRTTSRRQRRSGGARCCLFCTGSLSPSQPKPDRACLPVLLNAFGYEFRRPTPQLFGSQENRKIPCVRFWTSQMRQGDTLL